MDGDWYKNSPRRNTRDVRGWRASTSGETQSANHIAVSIFHPHQGRYQEAPSFRESFRYDFVNRSDAVLPNVLEGRSSRRTYHRESLGTVSRKLAAMDKLLEESSARVARFGRNELIAFSVGQFRPRVRFCMVVLVYTPASQQRLLSLVYGMY